MASLGNVLKRAAGTPLTGRRVRFHLLTQEGAALAQHEVEAVLHPVHEEARLDAIAEARAYCEEQGQPERLPVEADLRFMSKALRDPEDARKQLVLASELHLLRRGLIREQVKWLDSEYLELIRTEYPECFTQQDFDLAKREAKGFTEGGRGEPGPSSP